MNTLSINNILLLDEGKIAGPYVGLSYESIEGAIPGCSGPGRGTPLSAMKVHLGVDARSSFVKTLLGAVIYDN